MMQEAGLSQQGLAENMPGLNTLPGGILAPTPATPVYVYFPPNITRGARLDGRMSPIRRFFCLVVTFDLLLTCLIWLLTIMIAGNFNWLDVYQKQIVHYNLKTSLFDTVMASACRFVILMSFYGVLQINHWIIVALSTAGTGAFVVAKVIYYQWNGGDVQLLSIMLVLSGFILSWTEAWLLDIKVIPQERFAESLSTAPSVCDERTNLIRNYLETQIPHDLMSESRYSFYSPLGSISGSDEDIHNPDRPRRTRRIMGMSSSENDEFAQKGIDLLRAAWEILNSNKWGNEKEMEGDCTIKSFNLEGCKVFKLDCVCGSDKGDLIKVLYHDVQDLPTWNQTIKSATTLETINDSTDITCQVSKEGAIIPSKEYVTLRHLGEVGEYTVLASSSIEWPKLSSNPSAKRGWVGPGCWAIRSIGPTDGVACEVSWILNPQIKHVPGFVVDRSVPPIMAETMKNLKDHVWRTVCGVRLMELEYRAAVGQGPNPAPHQPHRSSLANPGS